MDALLVTVGTLGDVHPYIGLGQMLRARGHRVTLIGKEETGPLARSSGFEFIPIAPDEDADKPAGKGFAHRVLLSVSGRWRRLARAGTIVPLLRPVYRAIASRYIPGESVLVASSATLGARLAHEKLNVPFATIHLSPNVLRGTLHAPVQPPFVVPDWLPSVARRAAYWLLDYLVLDRLLAGPMNAFRAELGLPPVRRLLHDWRHSPCRVIGLFPEWFAPPQPGWPAVTRLVGFPLFDPGAHAPLPPQARDFLADGDPPVVFTPGTGIRNGRRFIEETIAACQRTNRRALLVTRFRDQVPDSLPDTVRHFDYLPFGSVLPHAAALVHFGGIGSAARALAAGIPQIIHPVKNDQFENARRLEDLGVAVVLRSKAYRTDAVARALEHLLNSETVTTRCRDLASRIREGAALTEACRLIEELHDGSQRQDCDRVA
jgi:UDP:flavonoid glycosyltransferase YjiC (YdhE family)